jgi:hypothetical protein
MSVWISGRPPSNQVALLGAPLTVKNLKDGMNWSANGVLKMRMVEHVMELCLIRRLVGGVDFRGYWRTERRES